MTAGTDKEGAALRQEMVDHSMALSIGAMKIVHMLGMAAAYSFKGAPVAGPALAQARQSCTDLRIVLTRIEGLLP
jgi:hypothetical protein